MKFTALIPFVVFSMFAQGKEVTTLNDLSGLEWKYRIIVVNEPPSEAEVLALLEKHTAEIDDRDIVWFVVKVDGVLTNYKGELSEKFLSRTRHKYGERQGQVILIGKDGGIKSRLDRLDIDTIFSEIDAMPMRRYEIP